MYDINQSEGFNLRRDVFIRMATFIRRLNQISNHNWILVIILSLLQQNKKILLLLHEFV